MDVLSPGIKRRICIARSLVNEPKLIILDHADKDLDREGYDMLVDLVDRLKYRTAMIIITENEDFCKLALKHYKFEQHQLVEFSNKTKNNKVKSDE